jgi:FAD-linked sulfhydryl oxidase
MPSSTEQGKDCGVCTDFRTLRKKVASSTKAAPLSVIPLSSETPTVKDQIPSKDQLPCPPDSASLGRSTWTFLHTMAAYFPQDPTPEKQKEMGSFLHGLGSFYPCSYCASHLRKDLEEHPPIVTSGPALSDWMCKLHNRVNERLGKPAFDCSRVLERWRTGMPETTGCQMPPELED